MVEILIFGREPDPALIAQSNADFAAWRETLDNRQSAMLDAFLAGEGTKDVAKMFNVSQGLVSQTRRKFVESYLAFVDDADDC
jgi:FixJ family two-component response regulator